MVSVTKRERSPASKGSSNEDYVPTRRGLRSLARAVSPPPTSRVRKTKAFEHAKPAISKPSSADVEAGKTHVADQVEYWSSHLRQFVIPAIDVQTGTTTAKHAPQLAHEAWIQLYKRNAGSASGCHFVVTQHDHPVAGMHYDLRLQCNESSSISFAIMYGLPGDANSKRLNRNATETRVHCLWNHLIETASHRTGSMLIWDTGEYEVLPYNSKSSHADEAGDSSDEAKVSSPTEQMKLQQAFQRRKIKLRLHGTRLPRHYTLALRLTKDNDRLVQQDRPSRKRRRVDPSRKEDAKKAYDGQLSGNEGHASSQEGTHSPVVATNTDEIEASGDEDEKIRSENAYSGAVNDIGSIHQRKWYLSIDRGQSGFVRRTAKSKSGLIHSWWEKRPANQRLSQDTVDAPTGFDRFVVGGRDVERSVVTGRLAAEVLADEGVEGYIPRGLWQAVVE